MQFQSNILQLKIDRPINIESTAFGAGMLAGLGSGFWENTKDLINIRKTDKIFTSNMGNTERSQLLSSWDRAIKMAMSN